MTDRDQITYRVKQLDKLIKELDLRGRKFIETSAFREGTAFYLMTGEMSIRFANEYEYFALTKSTKTLISIRKLLKDNANEDAIILSRTIFENYLACRYYGDVVGTIEDYNHPIHKEMISNPIGLALAQFNISEGGVLKNREGEDVGTLSNPSKFPRGKDKKYYHNLYSFMCEIAHSNYSTVKYYLDRNNQFTVSRENFPVFSRFIIAFVFTRLFERVVTVDGEDFYNQYFEKKCYELVEKSNAILEEIASEMIEILSSRNDSKELEHYYKRRISLIKDMKKALKEEIGSIEKT